MDSKLEAGSSRRRWPIGARGTVALVAVFAMAVGLLVGYLLFNSDDGALDGSPESNFEAACAIAEKLAESHGDADSWELSVESPELHEAIALGSLMTAAGYETGDSERRDLGSEVFSAVSRLELEELAARIDDVVVECEER
jgi:hypothetical protein